jgi:hypothetical protein
MHGPGPNYEVRLLRGNGRQNMSCFATFNKHMGLNDVAEVGGIDINSTLERVSVTG